MTAAILNIGMFGGMGHVVPAKSRWLSTSACLSRLLGGMLFHDLLPRAWRAAFGEWHIDRSLSEGDDYHAQIKSKVYRAKLWLSHDSTTWKSMVFSLCAGPVDNLLQKLQLVDAAGGGFKDWRLGTHTNTALGHFPQHLAGQTGWGGRGARSLCERIFMTAGRTCFARPSGSLRRCSWTSRPRRVC